MDAMSLAARRGQPIGWRVMPSQLGDKQVKTYKCGIRQERWSYETDADIILSPSGRRLSIFAHDSAYNNHPLQPIVQATIERSWESKVRMADGVNREFGVVELTRSEMEAWKACYNAALDHLVQVRHEVTKPAYSGTRDWSPRKRWQ